LLQVARLYLSGYQMKKLLQVARLYLSGYQMKKLLQVARLDNFLENNTPQSQ
jgi:hypothetical protein